MSAEGFKALAEHLISRVYFFDEVFVFFFEEFYLGGAHCFVGMVTGVDVEEERSEVGVGFSFSNESESLIDFLFAESLFSFEAKESVNI